MINASFLLKYAVTLLIQVFSYALHIASTTTQSSKPSISISTSSGIRGKTNLAWGHCREAPELSAGCKKTKLVCLYCAKVFAGEGINRFKQHLAGTKREVEQCHKCPLDVHHQMLLNLQGNVEKKRRAREKKADFNPYSAKQREHEERMIRHLEDDCKGDDDDDAEADGKKLMLSPEVANKGKSKITGAVKQSSAS
jgi:hypothetical protein